MSSLSAEIQTTLSQKHLQATNASSSLQLIPPLPTSIIIGLTCEMGRRWQSSAELTHPAAKDGGEDSLLAAFLHISEGEVVEMASETWSDSIPSPSRRSHGTDKINIY